MAFEEAKELADEKDTNEFKHAKPMRRKFLEEEFETQKQEENKKMIRCSKILERMVNQNNFDDIAIGELKIILN